MPAIALAAERPSGASDVSEVRFDDLTRSSSSELPMPDGGALRALRDAAEMLGVDTSAELYNEALRLATEGHLKLSRERLQILLGFNAEDGEARLLLAKVHVAGQRWSEALASLDEAQNCGVKVPMDLREAVEGHLRADSAAEEEESRALQARELGEIKALRQETRRLRSENAELLGRNHDLERETRKWAWTTTAVAAIGLLFIAGNLLLGGGESTSSAEGVEVTPVEVAENPGPPSANPAAPGAKPAVPVAAQPPATAAIAEKARAALSVAPGLDETELAVVVRGTEALVSGEVLTAKQRKIAEGELKKVAGISKVDTGAVIVLARTKGAEHTVQKGDILSKIASEYYGDTGMIPKIRDANQGTLKGGDALQIGQKLKIPPVGK